MSADSQLIVLRDADPDDLKPTFVFTLTTSTPTFKSLISPIINHAFL